MKIKVSYLIGVYNKRPFIESCIDSILSEESEDIAIEICLVDDGSTDGSFEYIKSRARFDMRIRADSFPANRGKVAAYNLAYRMSRGDYICLFGADDLAVKGRTKLLLEESRKYASSICGEMLCETADGRFIRYVKVREPSLGRVIIHNSYSGGGDFSQAA